VNQFARDLRERVANQTGTPIEAGAFIPIILNRSEWLPVVIHGILKAGGAWVPLDVDYPDSRLDFILSELDPAVVYTTSDLLRKHPVLQRYNCCTVDGDSFLQSLDKQESGPLDYIQSIDDIAYMIYTSGSTGQPKGVMVHHQGAVNRVLWMQRHYSFNSRRIILFKTPYTFDVSAWELLLPFFCGAAMVVAEPLGHMSMSYLAGLIDRERVTDVHFVPSVFRVFAASANPSKLGSLEYVFCSGEALDAQLAANFLEMLPSSEVHNLYGPTEASIDVSYWHCQVEDADRFTVTPIGRAIDNIALYILDEALQPVDNGSTGELHISGVGVAKGYFGRPELTAERFVENPHSSDPLHSRLYKTGDLARWMDNGKDIEFLGRIDFQVKINGLRVELGEIEALLCSDPHVDNAVVMLDTKKQQLIAIIAGNGSELEDRLRACLAENLPKYMLPRRYEFIPEMPLTTSGKADRKKLAVYV
jgi:amino acid adenylation domain-containing protein